MTTEHLPTEELPTRIKIGGAIWQTESDATAQDRLKEENNYGVTVEAKQVIRIDMTCSPAKRQESLLHELIHAIEASFLSPPDRTEERRIKTFTAGLFQVLRDNPDVVAFILAKE